MPPRRRLAFAILSTIRKIALLCAWILSQIASICNLIYKRGEPVAAAARRKIEQILDGLKQVDAAPVDIVRHMRMPV